MVNLLRASLNQSTGENLWKHVWAKDLQAGLIVAIVSLPLSLSLALASGFPPFAGLVSSIIGGCILSFVSGSETAIKGPASGLGAITLSSVYMLGAGNLGEGYAYTLAAIVLAGVLQIVSAVLRMGNLGYFFPSAVVHGMLASLGFIMFVKQIPALLGISADISSTLDIITQVPTLITQANPKVAMLGLGALLVILLYSYFFHNLSKIIPPIIPTLVIGIPVALSIGMHADHGYFFVDSYYINHADELLVQFPSNFMSSLQAPDFSKANEGMFWFFVLMFFMACNIESILTCKVVDQLDKQHRQTQFNKDLIALGIGLLPFRK
jgi:MFS superfamily sulfate permease-like transporter